ncbi:putative cobalt transporter CbtA [Nonomuraea polychroma]|uniref:Putative cobalt transporter CbtA n=1 Tax=Nonomuraea polychroma TaxID=46176 RepID=A0A438MLY2_9ACTN|nr:CbtA family protein [Nonomuraea polychroma]RVX46764.1 putative cobalt transporter CbtA [Nonomuraea polychroma]
MVRTLLVRGLLLGLLAGLIAGGFAFTFGEPQVDSAIALEAAHEAPGHDHAEEELVSRPGQKAGLFLATGLYGLAVGGVFALVYAGLRGRVGPRSEGALALTVAGTAFVAVILVPFVKYPASPPAVGDPETINSRTVLYLVMILVGLAATVIAVATARRVTAGPWARWVAAVVAFLVPVIAAWTLLPTVNEVPEGFSATLLWQFRLASLGTQLVFWTAFGVLFGWVSDRAAHRAAARATVASPS